MAEQRTASRAVAIVLSFMLVLSSVFSFGTTSFADEGGTVEDFDEAMNFYMYLNQEKPGSDENPNPEQLVDSGKTGQEQTLFLRWVYSDSSYSVDAKDMRIELLFPKGIVPAYPATEAVNFEKSSNPDGSTTLTVTWDAIKGGQSTETFVTFRAPNGTTPDGVTYEIPINVYYGNDKSKTWSKVAKYTTIAENFGWNMSRKQTSAAGTATNTGRTVSAPFTHEYNLSPLYNKEVHNGFLNTQELSFQETVTVSSDINVEEKDLSGTAGVTFSDFTYREGTSYLSSFKVNYEVENSDPSKEITYTAPSFTVKNVTVADSVTETKSITNALVAKDGKLTATAVGATGGKDPGVEEVALTNQWSATVNYTVGQKEDPKKSTTLTTTHESYSGYKAAMDISGTTKYVYAGDQVTYAFYDFKNNQIGAMESFKVVHTWGSDYAFPTSLRTGYYTNAPTTGGYTIYLYDKEGELIGQSPNLSYSTYKTYSNTELNTWMESGHSVGEIAKVEYDYGAVPAGFAVYSASYRPAVTLTVKEQKKAEGEDFELIDIDSYVDCTYAGEAVKTEPAKELQYTYKEPTETDPPKSRSKEMKNLSNPGALPAAGDLLEYTITITNKSGQKLQLPEIEDRSAHQSYYSGTLPAGLSANTYPAGLNAVVVAWPASDKEKKMKVKSAEIKTTPDKHLFIKLDPGEVEAGETYKVSYIMQVDADVTSETKLTNEFDAYGYPYGLGYQRIWMDGGYYEGGSTGQYPVSKVDISHEIKNTATGTLHNSASAALAKGETVDVTVKILNDDYIQGRSGSVHLANFMQAINNGGNGTAFSYVPDSGAITLPDGMKISVDATAGKAIYGSGYTHLQFGFASEAVSGGTGSIALEPGEEAVLTFKLKAEREGVSSSYIYESMSSYFYSFFLESTNLMYRTSVNSNTYSSYYNINKDSGNWDNEATSGEFVHDVFETQRGTVRPYPQPGYRGHNHILEK